MAGYSSSEYFSPERKEAQFLRALRPPTTRLQRDPAERSPVVTALPDPIIPQSSQGSRPARRLAASSRSTNPRTSGFAGSVFECESGCQIGATALCVYRVFQPLFRTTALLHMHSRWLETLCTFVTLRLDGASGIVGEARATTRRRQPAERGRIRQTRPLSSQAQSIPNNRRSLSGGKL